MAEQKFMKYAKSRMKERLGGEKYEEDRGAEQWALGARDKVFKAAGPVARDIAQGTMKMAREGKKEEDTAAIAGRVHVEQEGNAEGPISVSSLDAVLGNTGWSQEGAETIGGIALQVRMAGAASMARAASPVNTSDEESDSSDGDDSSDDSDDTSDESSDDVSSS